MTNHTDLLFVMPCVSPHYFVRTYRPYVAPIIISKERNTSSGPLLNRSLRISLFGYGSLLTVLPHYLPSLPVEAFGGSLPCSLSLACQPSEAFILTSSSSRR